MPTAVYQPDPEQCQWQLPVQCRNKSQWQVEQVSETEHAARICHGHLLDVCQTWSSHAPLIVNPIFMNWGISVVDRG